MENVLPSDDGRHVSDTSVWVYFVALVMRLLMTLVTASASTMAVKVSGG